MISNKSMLFFGVVVVSFLSQAQSSHWDHEEDYNPHPHYKFEYSVHDPHTHDIKSQEESRDGDYVKGYYKLKESDGSTREVHYTADKHSGFNAEVTKDGLPLYSGHQQYGSHQQYGGHQQYSEGGHYGGGHHATSSQNQNSKHYHQHKVVLHHRH